MVRRPATAGLALAILAAGCAFVPLPGPPTGRPEASIPERGSGPLAGARAAVAPEAEEPGFFGGFARLASVAALAAVLLAVAMPTAPAEAARSGGRMGGMGGGMRMGGGGMGGGRGAPQQARGGRTNINIGVSPFGYGGGFYGGGLFGPSLFGPTILPVPVPFGGGGVSRTDQALQSQQQQGERQMDGQSRQIEALQKELADLKAKK